MLDRGWTGHEYFAAVHLVHMNGRMYDTDLRRFLSPDNYVQDPANTQNYNRYQYRYNNPLKYSDPNGEFFWVIAAVVVGAYLSGASSQGTWNPVKWDWKSGKLWGNLAIGGLAGGVAAVAGPTLAGAIAPALTASGVSIAGGALIGAASGLIGGAIQGFGGTLVNGGNIGSAFKAAAIGGGAGALAGAAMGAAFSAVQLGIHNAKVNTALARGVKNPGVKLNYWTGEPVQPGRSAWSFSNATPKYVKATPVIEVGEVKCLGMSVDEVAGDEVLRGTTEFPDLLNVGDRGNITEFTKHGLDQSISRGFKSRDILKIMREGKAIQGIGRYGPQTKYMLGGNTVVVDNTTSKVITVFSNDIKNGGYLIPFK